MNFKILKFYEGQKMIVDLDFLKHSYYNGNLKGAEIFSYLFKLKDHKFFKNKEFNENIFIEFNIKSSTWCNFITFLKSNDIPYRNNYDLNLSILNDINELSNKLGGIPIFDEYYLNFIEEYKKENNKRKIKGPKDDIDELYDWKIFSEKHYKEQFSDLKEFSYYNTFRAGVDQYYIVRKKK